jgi:hypothetical protein
MKEFKTQVLIVGGSTGGCAAALSAASMDLDVILTEETDWIGGQLTSQAVPPDEHPWIEETGCTQRYRSFREGVRRYYRDHYPLLPDPAKDPHFNPGQGWVSRLCHEPRVALAVLEQMLVPARSRGSLRVLLNRKPVSVETHTDRIISITLENQLTGDLETISAEYYLDATELGDLLPLSGTEYRTGAESQAQTGEPHAVSGDPQPDNVQAITWCFPLAYDPDSDHVIDRPDQYDFWRNYVPAVTPGWPGKLLSWEMTHPVSLEPISRILLPEETGDAFKSFWLYRRILAREHYPDGFIRHEVTLVNWPQNDYLLGNIIDRPEPEVKKHLEGARQLSLSLIYWLQTEAPRPGGQIGYPGLYLRPDMVGTEDGLAKMPYIRESRRIRAEFTVTENAVGTEALQGKPAIIFEDSVGVGSYRIDLHPSTGGNNYIDISSMPFQIPLGTLIPIRMDNLLPACKNIGTTHITNGCYRLHPVEWNIGEAAGLLAAFCIAQKAKPRQVKAKPELLQSFQKLLRQQGFVLSWPQRHAL